MISKACPFVLFILQLNITDAKFCKEFGKISHQFHPLRHCQRSNKTVIAFSNESSPELCADFAKLNRGLAFNFSPIKRSTDNQFRNVSPDEKSASDEFFNCEVLECPEFMNFSSVVNDTRFDYYSLYARPPPSETSTCLPSIGMFILLKERGNYSTANSICESIGGNLAHIASEQRNFKLSTFLQVSTNSSFKERTAYVGLNEKERGNFITSMNEPLACFNFRAWSPGHPPEVRRPGCVALTPEASWKVFNCNRKLLFICELLTSGPNPFVNNLGQKCSINRANNRFRPITKLP